MIDLVPLPYEFDLREDAAAVHALLLYRRVPDSVGDVIIALASEIALRFGGAGGDLDWDRATVERFTIGNFLAHEVRVPKVPILEPLPH